MLFLISAKLRL